MYGQYRLILKVNHLKLFVFDFVFSNKFNQIDSIQLGIIYKHRMGTLQILCMILFANSDIISFQFYTKDRKLSGS